MSLDTYPSAQVEAMQARIRELEAQNKDLRDRFAEVDTERNGAQVALKAACAALDRIAAAEADAKQAREDEAWANERTVLVEFQPVTSGWYASAPDGTVGINATAPTIHAALRALRAKVEGGAK